MLHKTSYMKGFHLLAQDGHVGHVDDFLVDESWKIQYLVVDTSNWIGGKSVLISTSTIRSVDTPEKRIEVTLSRDQIKQSPSVETADVELLETLPPALIV